MKNLILIAVFSVFGLSLYSQTDITGVWNTGDQNTLVKIEKVEDVFIGKIVSSDNPSAKIGNTLIKDVILKKGKWTGQMFAPRKGEWYDAEFKAKENILEIEISVGFMSKTLEWTKEEPR